MSFVILATRKTHPAVVVTRCKSLRAANYIAKELKALSKPHEGINYKILESGCLYCSMCGKAEDWDNPTTCHKPKNPQDWTCGFADIVTGKTAR